MLSRHTMLTLRFQSTLPRGSDDMPYVSASYFLAISIHAPSRERRFRHAAAAATQDISIHAPSRERRVTGLIFIMLECISIHAPSRERPQEEKSYSRFLDFNPRSLAGATFRTRQMKVGVLFQSTLPRGSDIAFAKISIKQTTFQSTLPRGSDARH